MCCLLDIPNKHDTSNKLLYAAQKMTLDYYFDSYFMLSACKILIRIESSGNHYIQSISFFQP